jgi:LPLT family lysophospholipid transporter-like MFS transporter
MFRSFADSGLLLWRNGETRFSLLGTSMFWGAGVTLRFLLVLWVPVALGITDNKTPTTLNAMVAIGIVMGAAAAAKLVTLETVRRCMPAGILIGVMVVVFSLQTSLLNAYLVLMLQERGKDSVGAGNAIAVQNFGENIAMLVMLGLYTIAIKLGAPAVATGIGFGAIFTLAIAVLWWKSRR